MLSLHPLGMVHLRREPPNPACHLGDMAEQYQVAFHSRGCDLAQALVSPAGDVDTADAGDKATGEGMAHHQVQAVALGLRTLLQRGDLFQVALEQFLERGRLGLGTGLEGLGLSPGAARPVDRSIAGAIIMTIVI